jgi:hypothetical protein
MSTPLVCVLTTIQRPTVCVRRLAEVLDTVGSELIVVGDRKGPDSFPLPGAEFFSLADQERLPFRLASLLLAGHYARKNLGYLIALGRSPQCIYETDDDNMPAANWRVRQLRTKAQPTPPRPWMNVYRAFASADQLIWPRGFPLELLSDPAAHGHDPQAPLFTAEAPIQQGLANLAPDVDAIWRLVLDREFYFEDGRPSVYLPPGTWCPFNSQTTWWWPEAYPLLYLPSYCSFRMTDIWRSFVAQRCLWELGKGVVFHGPEVIQQRNPHHLLRDFQDELPGYLNGSRLVRCLGDLPLRPGVDEVRGNLLRCYEVLIAGGFVPAEEGPLVRAWLADLEALEQAAPLAA